MAKAKSVYSCTECGGQVLKWQGQCPHCQAWNTLVETMAEAASPSNRFGQIAEAGKVQRLSEVEATEENRIPTGVEEFDRVLGGGLVPGGVVLLGGVMIVVVNLFVDILYAIIDPRIRLES